MTIVTAGLVGGLVATILMTAVMMVMGDGGPPPTARMVATFAGGEPDDYAMPGMALHMLYGIVAGVVFALGVPALGIIDMSSIGLAVAAGFVYGIVLMVGGMVFWMRMVMGMEPDKDIMRMFGTVHVIYGLVLGAFVGAGILA
jgi:hypothetical protein